MAYLLDKLESDNQESVSLLVDISSLLPSHHKSPGLSPQEHNHLHYQPEHMNQPLIPTLSKKKKKENTK